MLLLLLSLHTTPLNHLLRQLLLEQLVWRVQQLLVWLLLLPGQLLAMVGGVIVLQVVIMLQCWIVLPNTGRLALVCKQLPSMHLTTLEGQWLLVSHGVLLQPLWLQRLDPVMVSCVMRLVLLLLWGRTRQ